MEKILSVSDLESIKTYIHSFLATHDRIITSDVYQNIKANLTAQYDEAVFKVQLSKAIKDGKLGNLTIVRGPHGGIKLAVTKPVTVTINKDSLETSKNIVKTLKEVPTVEDVTVTDNEEVYQKVSQELKPYFLSPTPVIKPASAPIVKHSIYLNGRKFEVPHTINEVRTLLNNVMELKEDTDGLVEFEGIKYTCTEDQLGFLDRFLFFFYGASYVVGDENDEEN